MEKRADRLSLLERKNEVCEKEKKLSGTRAEREIVRESESSVYEG